MTAGELDRMRVAVEELAMRLARSSLTPLEAQAVARLDAASHALLAASRAVGRAEADRRDRAYEAQGQ